MRLIHSVAFSDTGAEVTDSDIREAVLNYWNTASNSIKVSVVDTTSGGDTDACSETHAYLSGDESAMFNGTQYTVEIVNGPPPGTLPLEPFRLHYCFMCVYR